MWYAGSRVVYTAYPQVLLKRLIVRSSRVQNWPATRIHLVSHSLRSPSSPAQTAPPHLRHGHAPPCHTTSRGPVPSLRLAGCSEKTPGPNAIGRHWYTII